MFAVKGWSVDAASLKPQTELFKTSATGDKPSRKRKRSRPGHSRNGHSGEAEEPGANGRESDQKGVKHHDKVFTKQKNGRREAGDWSVDVRPQGERKPDRTDKNVGTSVIHSGDTSGSSKRDKKRQRREAKGETLNGDTGDPPPKAQSLPGSVSTADDRAVARSPKLTPMQSAMRQKLISARFRHLNETLYTAPSAAARQLFDQNPEMFEDYHAGFRQQVSIWPENPVDNFISTIVQRGRIKSAKQHGHEKRKGQTQDSTADNKVSLDVLPRFKGLCTIADLGCGDARLASTLTSSDHTTNMHLKILSYDLSAPSPLVTKVDIANLPLEDRSVDVAIFCLALMGTNWISFIEEAYRVLRWKGELWVAEIKSRFGRVSNAGQKVGHSVGGKRKQAALQKAAAVKEKEEDELHQEKVLQAQVDGVQSNTPATDVTAFVEVLKRRGFILKPPTEQSVDLSNKMFVKMEFVKYLDATKGKHVPVDAEPKKKKALSQYRTEGGEDITSEDEAKVLKPCLYKSR